MVETPNWSGRTIKRSIAEALFERLPGFALDWVTDFNVRNAERFEASVLSSGESASASPLSRLVKVKTPSHGIRYFEVSVREVN